jgi:hypothetical protein
MDIDEYAPDKKATIESDSDSEDETPDDDRLKELVVNYCPTPLSLRALHSNTV